MRIEFFKAHGVGNDYIFIDCYSNKAQKMLPSDLSKLAIDMSKRHTSIGSDGLVVLQRSETADVSMRMYNADGSEGKMCGNAIRCVSAYAYNNGLKKSEIFVETASGIYKTEVLDSNSNCALVRVDMKNASVSDLSVPFYFGERRFYATYVNVGNPHGVVFLDESDLLDSFDIEGAAKALKSSRIFSEEVNTEFVQAVGEDDFSLRVYERGSGETYACGTGACASVAAAVKTGIVIPNSTVNVRLKGGIIKVFCDGDFHLYMTGQANIVFYGEYEYEDSSEL